MTVEQLKAASREDGYASEVSKQIQELEKEDPLLKDNSKRYVVFPLKYHSIWDFYKKQEHAFWTAEELDLQSDLPDWYKLAPEEREFITYLFGMFVISQGFRQEHLVCRFTAEIQSSEARCFYGFQEAMENIHSEVAGVALHVMNDDNEEEKALLFRKIEDMEVTQKMAAWVDKWILNGKTCFAERILAFACVTGILFNGSFCVFFWLQRRGVMPGLSRFNELFSRDKGLHAEFACHLYGLLQHHLPESVANEIVRGAVDIERQMLCEQLDCSVLGLDVTSMSTYVEYLGDNLLSALGHSKIYNAQNPFSWIGEFIEKVKITAQKAPKKEHQDKDKEAQVENAENFMDNMNLCMDEDF